MCGRSRCTLTPEQAARATGVPEARWTENDRARYQQTYNLSPGGWGVVVKQNHDDHQPELRTMQ